MGPGTRAFDLQSFAFPGIVNLAIHLQMAVLLTILQPNIFNAVSSTVIARLPY